MTYRLEDIGECILADNEDMMSMFEMLSDLSLNCIDVKIDGKPVGFPGPNVLSAEVGGFPLVLYDESVVANECNVKGVVDKVKGRRLLSADWAYLINVGQCFEGGVREIGKSLIKYSIEMGIEFSYVKNETMRVTAECRFKNASQCSWRIHASVDKSNDYYYIRSYNKHHQCGMFFGTASKRRLNLVVIIDLIENDIRAMPAITPGQIQCQVKDKFGVDISYWVAWRATDAGRRRIFGDETSSYSYLPSYFDEAGKTNPGSIFHLDVEVEKQIFRRCFFAFAACLDGFKFFRPVVMLDGTFLKGRYKGVLLSAVGKDADEDNDLTALVFNSILTVM